MEKKAQMVTSLIIVAVLAVFLLVPIPGWMGTRCAGSMLLHHFWHANFLHLVANSLGIYAASMMPAFWRKLPFAYAAACIGFLFATRPVIGFSNILFALAGMYGAEIRNYWKRRETLAFVAGLALTSLIPNVSASTHIASFVIGYVLSMAFIGIKRIVYDYKRAGGK